MVGQIALCTFIMVLAAALAVRFMRLSRQLRREELLRRGLGVRESAVADSLLRDESGASESLLGKLAADGGTGWTAGQLGVRIGLSAASAMLIGIIAAGPVLGLVLAPLGALALPLWLRRAHAQRMALCDQQMPQALEVMALALRAGHPLPGALAIAASEAPSPIADELRRAVDEQELGRPIGDVLLGLGQRLGGCESVHTFVVAVLVLQQTGGNLIAVIERIVENARARASYHQRLRALTAEGRSSAKMLALLPGAFFVLAAMADPSYATTLLKDPSGNVILAVTIGLWAAGILWTRHLVRE
jgi:tight adherence protein B